MLETTFHSTNDTFEENYSNYGSIVYADSNSVVNANILTANFNLAGEIGGTMYFSSHSQFNIIDSVFYWNAAKSDAAAIYGVQLEPSYLTDTNITENNALKNIITVIKSELTITGGHWSDNVAREKSSGVFSAFTTLYLNRVNFSNTLQGTLEIALQTQVNGGFLFASIDSIV